MKIRFHGLLLVGVTLLGSLVLDGPFSGTRPAAAQGFGRGRDGGGGGGESRDERRDRWRRSMGMGGGSNGSSGQVPGGGNQFQGGGGGGRDRGGERGGGDGERRGEGRSSGSGSSGGGSSNSSSSSSDSKSTSSSGSASSMSQTDYAKGLVKMYDKNGDSMLQADERKGLTGRAAESDIDKDGVITIDELVAHLSTPATTAPPAGPSSGDGSSGGGDSGRREGDRRKGESEGAKRVYTGSAGGANSKEGDKRRTYRFSTTSDRLPKNLPSYFSRDTDGDGQVSMSEYSRTWSKSTVAEFRKYDLNDDGIITAKEATHSGSGG